MTTKEEKARLKSIRTLMIECVGELDIILGDKELIITTKVKEEKPEPKEGEVQKIGDLNIGDTGVVIEAEILEIARHAGTTKDGNAYEKASLMLSDKSGPIKLVLWNEQVGEIVELEPNDIIRVECWKVEKGYKGGVHELVYGKFGTINKVEKHII